MESKLPIKQRVQPQQSHHHRNLLFLLSCCSLIVLTSVSSASTQPPYKCHEDERSALLEFRQSFVLDCIKTTVDDGYYHDFSFPNKSRVASWNKYEFVKGNNSSKDCCTWDGVRCDEITGHVIGLDLGESCLYGYFPQNSSLFKLMHLQHLNLEGNNFKHSLIPQGFGQLSNLISLDLSWSRFSGQIPLEISRLSNLRSLDLSYSSGSIFYYHDILLKLRNSHLETLLNNLTRLNILALDKVDVSSTTAPITSHLSNRTSLRWLGLSATNLIGEFPSSIFQLPHLEYIDISYNHHLTGVFPEFQPNRCSYKLSVLGLSGTRFSGKLPSSLGDRLINLNFLGLGDVRFTGEVPSSFANLTRLSVLHLSNTDIKITPAFYNMVSKLNQLNDLDIGPIYFAEPTNFPSCLRNLTKLKVLNAFSCHFMGPVPSWLPNLTQLEYLDLSYNNLLNTSVNTILRLKHLKFLILDGLSLTFLPSDIPHNDIISYNNPQLSVLSIANCNLTEFPEFLKYQHELQGLYLSKNCIHGLVPSWLGSTSKDTLQVIEMEGNNLNGFEQSNTSVIIPWTKIRYLDLGDNGLQGTIPIPPISLSVYNLRNNSLIGDITEYICNNNLRFLDLSYNNLSGQIPKCFDKLGNSLVVLDLQANMLHGLIPPNFGTSCRLEAVNLSKNQLEGKLPRSLANCSTLRVLDIGNNAINDTFPSWLENLHMLQILVLRHNHFHGTVSGIVHPKSNVSFLSLRILDLSNNFLTGSLPIEYWPSMRSLRQYSHYMVTHVSSFPTQPSNMYAFSYNYANEFSTTSKGIDTTYSRNLFILKVIDLSSNNFTGKIPNSIGNLVGLMGLNFSNNDLTGEIPSSLTNVTALEWLDLSQNNLYGKIPDDLLQLNFLEIFNVSFNHLMGLIPHGKQFNTFDISSFKGNPGLCGNPLAKSCEDTDDGLPLPPPLPSTEFNFDLMDWIVMLLGYGSGLVVGIVGGMIFIDKHCERLMELFGRRKRKARVKRTRRFNH